MVMQLLGNVIHNALGFLSGRANRRKEKERMQRICVLVMIGMILGTGLASPQVVFSA
jgi:hypothetical protein